MKIVRTHIALNRWRKIAIGPVIFVPTMGALHAGHRALIVRARKIAGKKGSVVVSIFVNPMQFGLNEDLTRYPRPFAADAQLCKEAGVDLIFNPSPSEVYPPDFSTAIEESSVSQYLCGAARPGHFRGVCTVVAKLFNMVSPHQAVFGRKDYQQCQVLARMVRDLAIPVKLVFAETVREADGLALSSRNVYLTPEQRAQAPVIRKALLDAQRLFRAGETSASKLVAQIKRQITRTPAARIDYLTAAAGNSLRPVSQLSKNDVIATAVFFGNTRLIDNITLR